MLQSDWDICTHQSPARLQNIAAIVKYLWHLEKDTGTKNSRGLIPALAVNYSVTLGKAFTLLSYGSSASVTVKRVPQHLPPAQVSWEGWWIHPQAQQLPGSPRSPLSNPWRKPPEPQPCRRSIQGAAALPSASSQGPCRPQAFTGFHTLPEIRFPSRTSGAALHARLAAGLPAPSQTGRCSHLLVIKKLQGERCFALLLCILATNYKYNSGK